jgi:hypothetical protein
MAKRTRGRGRTRCQCQSMKGGGECTACTTQNGGKMSGLNPESLSGDSFDRSGGSLAKQAHNLYLKQSYDLASFKGGRARSKGRSAKKYSRKSRSKSRSRSRSKSKY